MNNVTVNGGMSGGGFGSAVGTVTSNNTVAAMMRAARENKNKRPKKKLNYNPREISSQLIRAGKSRNAGIVLVRAKGKLSALHQALASGQYNDREVRTAIAHARRMVECSRIKVRNLREEEMLKSRNDRDHRNGEQKKRSEVKRRVRKKEQDMKVKMALEENQRVLKEKTQKQILMQKRRMHRNTERGKITEAHMKYLEDQLKENQNEHAQQYDGVSLELSYSASQMSDLKMMEQQIQQEAELEVELEYVAIEASVSSALSSAPLGAPSPGGESVGAQSASVDISV